MSIEECPDTEDVAALLGDALDAARRAAILDHAADCASCHALIAELAHGLDEPGSARRGSAAGGQRGVIDGSAGRDTVRSVARRNAGVVDAARDGRIGRYHLLEIVGAGGMGVVWGAWDPELARRVALKLVHPRLAAARDRILAEGQALGKLSHPNVVPIYDVGVVDHAAALRETGVYLVMEWVQGTTLRAYASTCGVRELVAAYRQAGEGLAAAHRAGLVHRDFKPDNAIRGDDGRVRVLDFGLARSDDEAHEPGRLAGTPRYMPPEQAAGEAVSPAADQFAFAVSLREGLAAIAARATKATPPWLTAITARATAKAPGDRYPSMEALLHALGRDPARLWRQRGVVALGVAVAATAFGVGRAHDATPTCTGGDAQIARSWNPPLRAAATAHLHGLGAFGAGEAERVAAQLDAYAGGWRDAHQRACVAHERGELTARLYEQRLHCLARAQAALTTAVELVTSVAPAALPPALVAARALPSTSACAELATVPPPPDAAALAVATIEPAIDRARVLAVAARPEAIAIATATVAAAEQTHYDPLIARALLVQGRAELELNAGETAAPASLRRALELALASGDDHTAVEAYARLLWAVARYHGDTVDSWPVMAALATRTGPSGRFGRALLYNNKAIARIATDDRAGARGYLQRALADAASRPLADDELELISVPQNLALVSDDPRERQARSRQAADQLTAALGPHHPDTLRAQFLAATLATEPAAAMADFARACEGLARWHPSLAVERTDCAFERAWLADALGDRATARAAMAIARRDPLTPTERARGTIAAAYLAATDDALDATALDALIPIAGALARSPALWVRADAADAFVVLAMWRDRTGDARAARAAWTTARDLLEPLAQPIYERRRARARAEVAKRATGSR